MGSEHPEIVYPPLVTRVMSATGHRPSDLGGYSPAALARVEAVAVWALLEWKPEFVITGMAQGWDQAVASAARTLGIPYWCAIPFKGQELMWPDSGQRDYRELLRDCAGWTPVSPGGYHPTKMHVRNRWMIQRGNFIGALYNENKQTGGTAGCVSDVRRMCPDKPILNAWPEWVRRGYA